MSNNLVKTPKRLTKRQKKAVKRAEQIQSISNQAAEQLLKNLNPTPLYANS